jgi:hypothetical protein
MGKISGLGEDDAGRKENQPAKKKKSSERRKFTRDSG